MDDDGAVVDIEGAFRAIFDVPAGETAAIEEGGEASVLGGKGVDGQRQHE